MLKICGISSPADRDLVCSLPVDFYGLWYRTNGGAHELSLSALADLAQNTGGRAKPCLVTLQNDPEVLADALAQSQVEVVQLHGFTLPADVHGLRGQVSARGRTVQIIKVLHMQDAQCIEQRMIGAYVKAGVDLFIVDNFYGRQAVGSTGCAINLEAAAEVARAIHGPPVLLAGGVTPALMAQTIPGTFAGFDVDSAARVNGTLSASKITDLIASQDQARGYAHAM